MGDFCISRCMSRANIHHIHTCAYTYTCSLMVELDLVRVNDLLSIEFCSFLFITSLEVAATSLGDYHSPHTQSVMHIVGM